MRGDPGGPFDVDRPESTRPYVPERRDSSPGLGLAVATVAAVVALLVAGYWLWRERRPPAPEVGEATAAVAATPSEAPPRAVPLRPPLAASDAWIRDAVAALSAHPQLAAWLLPDDLVRRFVAAVVAVAEGGSPSAPFGHLRPTGGFRASSSAGRWFVDPASFRRYDRLTEVVLSLDTAGCARLLAEARPLLDEAYREIGDPEASFEAALARAIGRLVAVPVPDGEPELVPQGPLWAFADRSLEQLTTAEKHLLRLGPDNARRLQAKLRELAAAAALPLP